MYFYKVVYPLKMYFYKVIYPVVPLVARPFDVIEGDSYSVHPESARNRYRRCVRAPHAFWQRQQSEHP